MIPIVLCSVLSVAIILERLWTLRARQVIPRHDVDRVEQLIHDGNLKDALIYCSSLESSYTRILYAGLRNAGQRRSVIKETVEEAGRQEVVFLERYLNVLGTIAAIAPLLGLLGTVFGMIDIFSRITAGGIGDPTVLAGGISVALITTAAGLIVAIPTLVFHRHFEGMIDRYIAELERSTLLVVEHIKSGH